jgi:hypothetical protein
LSIIWGSSDATFEPWDIYDLQAVPGRFKSPRDLGLIAKANFPESNSANLVANIEFLEKLPRPTDKTILRPITWIWMPV